MTLSAEQRSQLLDAIDVQRLGCELAGSPLSSEILGAAAADVERSGPTERVLAGVAGAAFGDAVLLRLLAGLHSLVLQGRAPELAQHYPSAGVGATSGSTAPAALAEAVFATVAEHEDWLIGEMARGVQTNEVGRSASMLGGYLELAGLGLPLRILEVGASAGLNLLFDRYHYVAGEATFGPRDSPLVFREPWFGRAPDLRAPLEVAERRGSDLVPIDVGDPAGRLRLRSFIWPDQAERLARLDAALEVAAPDPPVVDAAPAAQWITEQLATPAPGRCTVVTHAITFQYLAEQERKAFQAALASAGEAATRRAPLAWLRLEPGGDQAELRVTLWPGGSTTLLATSSFHGPPVVWRAPEAGVGRRAR